MQAKQDDERRFQTEAHEQHSQREGGSATRSGADLLRGALRYDEESGNWYLGDANMTPYLARYRDREVMIVIAPLGKVGAREVPRLECEICGCALDDMGDCPRCQLHFVQAARRRLQRVQREMLFAEIDQIVEQRWQGGLDTR
jgi:hypothetical protein